MINEEIEVLPVVFELSIHLRQAGENAYASAITDIKGETDLARMMTATLTLVQSIALVEEKSAQDVLMDLLEIAPTMTSVVAK